MHRTVSGAVLATLAVALQTAAAAAASPANPATGVSGDTASDGPIEIVVVRSEPAGQPRETPVIAGSGTAFTDCPKDDLCPAMLVIPSSQPGLVLGELTGPDPTQRLHGIAIKAFAIGRTEVTVAQYQRCVAAGACRPAEWREPGNPFNVETGRNVYYRNLGAALSDAGSPIVGVSYDDAVAYAQWLSRITKRDYRLPSDTEWEYAARAGSYTSYWWGDEPKLTGKIMASCRGCGSDWDGRSIAAAESFDPNPWGLHNVHGNVWEWVADYYCGEFSLSPVNGTPRLRDDCPKKDANNLRVLRGGSSFYEPRFMRSASRLHKASADRSFSIGFRIARTLLP